MAQSQLQKFTSATMEKQLLGHLKGKISDNMCSKITNKAVLETFLQCLKDLSSIVWQIISSKQCIWNKAELANFGDADKYEIYPSRSL